MKSLKALVALCVFCVPVALASPPSSCDNYDLTETQWRAFSKNLVLALSADNEGLKQSALRQIARYGTCLDVDVAVFDIMEIYQNHKDDQVRRLAVVALGSMQHRWAMGFLERAVRFEKSASVKQTIESVLAEYRAVSA